MKNKELARSDPEDKKIEEEIIQPYFHPGLLTPMAHQVQIGEVIIITEKCILPPVPSLGNMMGKSGNHNFCYPGHGWIFL